MHVLRRRTWDKQDACAKNVSMALGGTWTDHECATDLTKYPSLAGYYTNGNRGVIYRAIFRPGHHTAGECGGLEVAVKEEISQGCVVKRNRQARDGTLESEGHWLALLNGHGIGPKLVHADDRRVITEFVEGRRLLTFLAEENERACRWVGRIENLSPSHRWSSWALCLLLDLDEHSRSPANNDNSQ